MHTGANVQYCVALAATVSVRCVAALRWCATSSNTALVRHQRPLCMLGSLLYYYYYYYYVLTSVDVVCINIFILCDMSETGQWGLQVAMDTCT